MRSLFSRSRPSFPRLSFAVPVLAVLCAVLFVWVGESEARPEYASIQAGFGPAKASYLPVTVGGKTLQIKVPEDFVLAEGVEETEWYKKNMKRLTESLKIPLLVFVLPDDLHMLKEFPGHEPEVHFTISAYTTDIDKIFDSKMFAKLRVALRRSMDKYDRVAREDDEVPGILNYVYEDETVIAWIFTPDTSSSNIKDSKMIVWYPIAETYIHLENKVISVSVTLSGNSSEMSFVLLKQLMLRYLER